MRAFDDVCCSLRAWNVQLTLSTPSYEEVRQLPDPEPQYASAFLCGFVMCSNFNVH